MNKQYILFCTLILSLSWSCKQDNEKNIQSFYYPTEALKEGLVYEYRAADAKDSINAPYYWYYKTEATQTGTFLNGTRYNANFQREQIVSEEIVGNGVLLNNVALYQNTPEGKEIPIAVKKVYDNVFPFEIKDSTQVYLYQIAWKNPQDTTTTTTIIRNRRYKGKTTFKFQDKTYNCVEFEIKEAIQNQKEGILEIKGQGKELYAEGIGLVYYKKSYPNLPSIEYSLFARYDMKALEEKIKKK